LRPLERYHLGWAAGPVEILKVREPELLTVAWEEDGDPTTVRWDLARHSASTTTVRVTHRGFADPDLAVAYRAEWHDTLIHIRGWHTRPSDLTRHREQQRRYLLARLLAAVDAVRRRRTGMGDDAADAAGERPHSPGLRYFPVTLDGDVVGYLYASESDDSVSFTRQMASRHDTFAAAVE